MKHLNPTGLPFFIPFIGWVDLDKDEAHELGLPLQHDWRALIVEWFGFGLTLMVEAR